MLLALRCSKGVQTINLGHIKEFSQAVETQICQELLDGFASECIRDLEKDQKGSMPCLKSKLSAQFQSQEYNG